MSSQYLAKSIKLLLLALSLSVVVPAGFTAHAAQQPHGLEPADDMPFMPELGGLRNKPFRNHYGQLRHLSEAIVLRQSSIANGTATVPAGGLYYLSEVKDEVRPLRSDPFIILGEHAYLVDFKTSMKSFSDVTVKKGDKLLLDEQGYRIWFDYATDHYDKPYAQLALISPAGHWPLEFPVSTSFPELDGIVDLNLDLKGEKIGNVPQIDPYFQDPTYEYGASRFTTSHVGYDEVTFSNIEFPYVSEATFSMSRPWVLDVRQDDYRFYKDKRIYTYRQPEGFLVKVTDFMGEKVLAEKLVRPITSQSYKDREGQIEDYSLTLPEEDMRIEITLQPEFLKNSDFVPWSNDVPYGWTDAILSLVVYTDLITVKNGEAWPLDERYTVGLEANTLTAGLQRLTLENAEPFTLDNTNDTYTGPMKWSHVWSRNAFTVTANGFDDKGVSNYFVRGQFFERTDNLVLNPKRPRKDIDFFVGSTPTLIPILEDTFLTRFADTAYSTVVEPSHFTSHPKVLSDMAFAAPDPTAPFVARMRGFGRASVKNAIGDSLTTAEGLVIRGSYVDWKKGEIVIPPSGLYYTSRNSRNVRVTRNEAFLYFGKKAYLASFDSTTTVRRDFNLDFWKLQADGTRNPIFWQDSPVGVDNKMLRYSQLFRLDDHPMAMMNIVKYSGNNFGAPFHLAAGLAPEDKGPDGNRYAIHNMFAEGATYVVPEFIGDSSIHIREFATPSILDFHFTLKAPTRKALGVGESAKLGTFDVKVIAIDEANGYVTVELSKDGKTVETRNLGPLNEETRELLPQHERVVDSLQLIADEDEHEVMVELDVQKPFENGMAGLWLFEDVQLLEQGQSLPTDDRFVVRPDVCGHCYQLNELLLANKEAIVLDMDNPRFDGPIGPDGNPLFTVVIDTFDGEMIHGWHVESTVKGRTFESENLAFNPRNNVDCLIGVNGTIEGFLRASMLERAEFQEYWRLQQHRPILTGLAAWFAPYYQ